MPRLRALVATLLVGLAGVAAGLPFAPAAQAAGATVGTRVGFANGYETLWLSDADLARDLDGMAAVGARWLRVDFDWSSVQAGGRSSWNWSPVDRVVREASERGLSILAMPAYTPTWARPANTPDKHPPTNPDDYARFVRAAVERYAPMGVHHWEIWNEPNTSSFWSPSPDAKAYATLFKKAAAAVHAADTSATVITAGLAPAADVAGQSIAPKTFLSRLYAAGAGPSLDAVGMHPYTFPYEPMLAAPWNPFYELPSMHDVMAANGDGAKKIWATEVGWGTGTSDNAVSRDAQARMIQKMLDAWLDFPFAANLFYYSYRDHGTNAADIWLNFGIVKRDWSAKPARDAMRSVLTRSLSGSQPAPSTPVAQPGPSSPAGKSAQGLWIASSDARVLSASGPKAPQSSALRLNRPVVGAASTPGGKGAWLVASDGGIFSFGDARFYGSTGAIALNQPIVGMASTPTGRGYWLVASDGGIFSFGDARFHGSTGGRSLRAPIVGIAPSATGNGYWLVGGDGAVFSFGDAPAGRSVSGATVVDAVVVGH